jgi:hypothetical protein
MATAATVSFGQARGVNSPNVGVMRTLETFSVLPALSTNVALDGEFCCVGNTGAAVFLCAVGSAPDEQGRASVGRDAAVATAPQKAACGRG